jgi:hypothetical protein
MTITPRTPPPLGLTDYSGTVNWDDAPISREFELRLGPTDQTAAGGFRVEGAVCVRGQNRFAQLAEATPHLDDIARQAAQSRLQSMVAAASRAVCVQRVRVLLDPNALRFAIEADDPPHPACDAQLRLRLERGLGSWLREHWIRKQ